MLVKAANLEFDGEEAELVLELLAKDKKKFLLPSMIMAPKWGAPTGATVFVETYSYNESTKILKVFGDIAW
ncbi:MAG: hypothetical protein K2X77_00185 [Candidatus Obscuribacterales bacterium]|jgi:hypothetical protein|nr:hypothetical protein [Candidatus Obscuribacterales bacterium]